MNQISLKCSKCGGPITIQNGKYICLNCQRKKQFKQNNSIDVNNEKDQSKLQVLYS